MDHGKKLNRMIDSIRADFGAAIECFFNKIPNRNLGNCDNGTCYSDAFWREYAIELQTPWDFNSDKAIDYSGPFDMQTFLIDLDSAGEFIDEELKTDLAHLHERFAWLANRIYPVEETESKKG